jgi:hypothetical protein
VSGVPRPGPGPVVASHNRIVLRNTQARAELPSGSGRTIAASRIEAHRAGAVAVQAVEHTYAMVVQLGDDAHGCAGGAANAAAIAARAASCLDRSAAWIVARRPRHRRSS